jgi:16S rRNA (cytidine1402-2'-O)-methyltransferase
MSTLSIVATPIGNMEDITLRALRTLKEADVVFAEDTRVTAKLFARHGISVPLKSYHQRSGRGAGDAVIALLQDGRNIALVTDAGTPGISDPGNELIERIRVEAPDTKIEPIPGPSAVTAALSVAGLPTNEFLFLGFLPHKKGRKTLLDEIARIERTVVLYESPHRIGKLAGELALRMPERRMVVARELTKMFESVVVGSVAEVAEKISTGRIPAKGEFVVILGPA